MTDNQAICLACEDIVELVEPTTTDIFDYRQGCPGCGAEMGSSDDLVTFEDVRAFIREWRVMKQERKSA